MTTATAKEPGAAVTLDELTRELSVSRRSLNGAIKRGEFPPPDFRIGGRMRWRRETVTRWIAAQAGA